MTCPVCGGSQLAGHPAGWLAIDHTNACTIRDAEDQTQAADHTRCAASPAGFVRAATDTERVLLTALGHVLPTTLDTTVRPVTRSVIARTWPVFAPTGTTP